MPCQAARNVDYFSAVIGSQVLDSIYRCHATIMWYLILCAMTVGKGQRVGPTQARCGCTPIRLRVLTASGGGREDDREEL
jgi:hypothetical protein